jgi:hypothetical protein
MKHKESTKTTRRMYNVTHAGFVDFIYKGHLVS